MQRYVRGELVVVLDCADLERAAAFWTTVLATAARGMAAAVTWGWARWTVTGRNCCCSRPATASPGKTGFTSACGLLTSTSRSHEYWPQSVWC